MTRESSQGGIAESVLRVQERIRAAALRVGRDPAAVRLVAVSKAQGPDRIREAYAAGLRDFGENRVEEAIPKLEAVGELPDVRWHMVGHIQSRKARRVVGGFCMVHSVDRLKIARLLDQACREAGVRLPVLLECNMSGESTKEGWDLADEGAWEAAAQEFAAIVALPGLEVRGLMTMAPWTDTPETVRPHFRRLRALRDWLASRLPGGWGELSMGMTDDYEVAVEEGATLVRIGRAIFGPRPVE